jgi:phage terminase small subunit
MALTPKQEKFCQCVVSGMSYKDSYLAAYDCNSDNAAYVEGSKLALREDIQARIEALQKPIKTALGTQALTETERIKAILWEELENARTQQDHTAIARYTDQLNKLNNAYKDSTPVEDNNTDIGSLDTTKLFKLVGTA